MKPFIISFIRTHLQSLQRELEYTARFARLVSLKLPGRAVFYHSCFISIITRDVLQTPAQYLRLHDKIFLDPAVWAENGREATTNGDHVETVPFSAHNKRKSTDR
jgi:hypothetical protein